MKQVDNIIKKCKQELFENKDIATETIKSSWQIINTVKLSLQTISVLQWNSFIIVIGSLVKDVFLLREGVSLT